MIVLKKLLSPTAFVKSRMTHLRIQKIITEIYIAPSVNKIAKTAFDGIDNLTIYAEKGSYAEKFAVENKINYKTIRPSLKIRRLKIQIIQKSETVRITANIIIMMLSMMTASLVRNN